MINRALSRLHGNVVAYLALFLAIGAGGGYAIAATSNTTVHGCVVKKTDELLIRSHCARGQTKLTWAQRGPAGLRGRTGSTGPAGAAPPSAWAVVNGIGQAEPSDGITATHTGPGTYQITVTAPACANKENAAVVSISDAYPPSGHTAGSFPVAWVENSGVGPFTVYTGVTVGGTFSPEDETFNIQDTCGVP
jgi:hypothetical protein